MNCSKRIRFTNHAEERIRSRGIPLEAVLKVLEKPEHTFFDINSDAIVYVSEKNKLIVVAVPEGCKGLRVVTVIPSTRIGNLIERRLRSGRWIPLG